MSVSGQNRRFEERYPNGCFPIHKRSLRGGPANGRFWPKAAIGARACLMTHMGLNRTSSAMSIYVRCWGLSRRNRTKSGHSSAATRVPDKREKLCR